MIAKYLSTMVIYIRSCQRRSKLLAYFQVYSYKHIFRRDQWLSKHIDEMMHKEQTQDLKYHICQLPSNILSNINIRLSTESWINAAIISIVIILLFQILVRIFQVCLDFALINNNPQIYGIISFFRSVIEYAPINVYDSIDPLFLINSSNTYDSRQMLSTIWSIMATLVSFSFVINIFLIQFINKDNNDARLAPIFALYSKFNLIIIFGLVNIGMMGVTILLLNMSNFIKPGALSSIIVCNFILFLISIGSITYLFGKAFEFIFIAIPRCSYRG